MIFRVKIVELRCGKDLADAGDQGRILVAVDRAFKLAAVDALLRKDLAVVLCGAIVFSLAASLLYSQAKLTEASENLADTQKVLLEQQSVETQLRSRLTEKYTEDYIESYVADRYNMRKATQSQIQYFSVHQNDLGKVVQSEEGGPIARFLRQIFG